MRTIRIEIRRRPIRPADVVLPLGPHDPDVVRAKQLRRGPGGDASAPERRAA